MSSQECPLCKGEMVPGRTEVVLRRGRSVVVIEAVPALVCQDCGEASLDAETSRRVYAQADAEVQRGVALEFCTFAA